MRSRSRSKTLICRTPMFDESLSQRGISISLRLRKVLVGTSVSVTVTQSEAFGNVSYRVRCGLR